MIDQGSDEDGAHRQIPFGVSFHTRFHGGCLQGVVGGLSRCEKDD